MKSLDGGLDFLERVSVQRVKQRIQMGFLFRFYDALHSLDAG